MALSKSTIQIFSKLEQQWLSNLNSHNNKKTRILCIDGGGITVDCAGAAVIHLERQIRLTSGDNSLSIADFFDLIAGAGVGAILAALLLADNGSGRPLYSANEAVSFLSSKSHLLFNPKKTLFFQRQGFSGKSMEKVLKEVFKKPDGKSMTLTDTCKPLLVPCFDLKTSAPFVFSKADASQSASFNFELWKVCRATSATPGLFKPFTFSSVNGKTTCASIDGGIVMNNPAAAAVTHVLHNKRDFPTVATVDDLLVLSLGNGSSSFRSVPVPERSRRRFGNVFSVVSIASDGASEAVDQMLGNAFCWNRDDYVRVQANGSASEGRFGSINEGQTMLRERGIETLPFGGKKVLKENNGECIDKFVDRLLARGGTVPNSPCTNLFADGR